jgi:Flp pilus assembly protein TadG
MRCTEKILISVVGMSAILRRRRDGNSGMMAMAWPILISVVGMSAIQHYSFQ